VLLLRHCPVTVEIPAALGKAIVDVTQWECDLGNLVLLFGCFFLLTSLVYFRIGGRSQTR